MKFEKQQIPSTKHQRNTKPQAPNHRPFAPEPAWCLKIGASLELGAWSLVLPGFALRAAPLITTLSALSAHAHPGHGLFELGPAHALASPFHLLVLALMGTGLFLAARFIRSPKIQQLARVAGVAAVLLSLLVWASNS